jgi:hypothetical protein
MSPDARPQSVIEVRAFTGAVSATGRYGPWRVWGNEALDRSCPFRCCFVAEGQHVIVLPSRQTTRSVYRPCAEARAVAEAAPWDW